MYNVTRYDILYVTKEGTESESQSQVLCEIEISGLNVGGMSRRKWLCSGSKCVCFKWWKNFRRITDFINLMPFIGI